MKHAKVLLNLLQIKMISIQEPGESGTVWFGEVRSADGGPRGSAVCIFKLFPFQKLGESGTVWFGEVRSADGGPRGSAVCIFKLFPFQKLGESGTVWFVEVRSADGSPRGAVVYNFKFFPFRNLEGLERFGLEKCDQLTAVLEALLYTEAGGGAPLKDVDQVLKSRNFYNYSINF
jgi:hypothetical protein